jgi:hypothetical protein
MTKVDTTALKAKYDELQAKIDALQEEIRGETQKMIASVFEEFFTSNPKAHAVAWVQFTPYWNDGDSTYFRVGEPHLYFSDEAIDDLGFEEGEEDQSVEDIVSTYDDVTEDEVERAFNEFDELSKVIRSIEDAYMEMIFDDHVSVVYTREGFTTEEHSHE